VGTVDFDWLLHHEFGHEWWANKVSNKDWGHMWIQEGICSFGDAMFTEEYGGREAYLTRMKQTAIATQNKLPIVQGDTVDSRQAYHPDIYGKGAFFMHTLRFVLGDQVFFPALKSFALDPRYTYDNMVVTDDVLKHFNAAAGKDLSPLFKLFLYSTDKLQVHVKQVAADAYTVRLGNMTMPLPFEIITSSGKTKLTLSGKDQQISSTSMPIIDPDGYYLKTVEYQ
jgi:aminopeptidase N